ncbi:MAG: transposase, partial [Myxococcota bacterium]
MREHLPVFLERLEARGVSLPAFVRDELEAFVTCGDFEHGFLVAQCQRCGDTLRVPFACKSRGVCPSCMGRRMGETAALLVDHRLPACPWRQWVLSFEGPTAVRLGYDTALLKQVCQRFAHRVMQSLRAQAKREHGLASSRDLHPGILLVVQRFRSDLGLYVHIHALVTDGCYARADADTDAAVDASALPGTGTTVRFWPTTGLDETHLQRVLVRLHADLAEHLEQEPAPVDDATLACLQLALPGLPSPGLRALADSPPPHRPMTATAFGMSLHAATCVDGRDRRQLERVCRYLLRPAFAHDAVVAMPDGKVRIRFKQPSRTGATFTQVSRDTFLARLCALVPPPGFHMVRYYGVLAGRHALKDAVAPRTQPGVRDPVQLPLFTERGGLELAALTRVDSSSGPSRDPSPNRLSWARLLARVFAIDVEQCRLCGGRMRVVQAVTDPDDIA